MISQVVVEGFIHYGKIVSAGMAFAGLITFLYQKLVSPVVRKVVHISSTIDKLDTNCIPTIQRSLDDQDVVLGGLKRGHEDFKTQLGQFTLRQDGLEKTVTATHTALLNHLENTSREKRKKVKV